MLSRRAFRRKGWPTGALAGVSTILKPKGPHHAPLAHLP
jgi:hypothetical protein